MRTLVRDRLRTFVLADGQAVGAAAAAHAGERLRERLAVARRARVVFAAAASQVTFLDALTRVEGIDWDRVEAFHMDEYVGLPLGDERSFGQWLDDHIFSRVRPGRIELLDGGNPDPASECERYGSLLAEAAVDLVLLGIGENGHLAFNDPHVADFDDPLVVKLVEIDDMSRHQQVRDGAFDAFEHVPRLAMTVTMSALLASTEISGVVLGPQKAAAVAAALDGPIGTACPASSLRNHPAAVLYVDEAAASQVAG